MDEENTDKNEKIIAQKFFDWWHSAYKESKESLAAQWNNGAKAYTCAVLCEINENSFISKLKKIIGDEYEIYQEYYNCDVVFYKNEKKLELIPNWLPNGNNKKISGTWLKQIEIHLEHENNPLSSWQELVQLLVVPGKELNVLVTYPDKSNEEKVKKAYETILKDTDITTPLLVIFGYSDDNGKTIDWKGFVYNKLTKKFEEIIKKA